MNEKYGFKKSMIYSILITFIWFIASYLSSDKVTKFLHSNHLHLIIISSSFYIIAILGVWIIFMSYNKLRDHWRFLDNEIKINIYNLVLKMIGIYSIFIVGIWKCNDSNSPFFSSIYISFIILSAVVSISIVNNILFYYLPQGNIIYIPRNLIRWHKIRELRLIYEAIRLHSMISII